MQYQLIQRKKCSVKTIRELFGEVMASEELKMQAPEATKAGRQKDFLKEHGYEIT